MWRERLGRQRAQAEAVDLRLKLSSRLAAATAGGNGAGAGDAELDEAVLQSLQAEMQRADHLADELARFKVGGVGRSGTTWTQICSGGGMIGSFVL